jgi:vacuolar protein sorting-associated protein 13A/C
VSIDFESSFLTFTQLAKEGPANCVNVTLSARERLDLNISTTFAELAITMANQYGRDGQRVLQKARGSYDPYRIRNRTGSSIVVWPEVEGGSGASDPSARKIAHDETIDWRFDDWKATREVGAGINFLASL